MEEITIVRRRSRVIPVLIAILVLAAIAVAVLYVIGTGGVANIGAASGTDPLTLSGGFAHGIA